MKNELKPSINWKITSFIALVHLFALLGGFCFSWSALAICLSLYWITGCLGITLGFHRLLTHKSFKVPKWLEYFFATCGTLALQGGPLTWVSVHKTHHFHSDQELDPHSPREGFWWAHIGWILHKSKFINDNDYKVKVIPELLKDYYYKLLEHYGILFNLLLAKILYMMGGWSFVIWGIFVRLVLVYHTTWLVNSACHLWGYRTFYTPDRSRNNFWVALLTFGEGFHNAHHRFQDSARHGLEWWEFDITFLIIKFLGIIGLAKNIKLPFKSNINWM